MLLIMRKILVLFFLSCLTVVGFGQELAKITTEFTSDKEVKGKHPLTGTGSGIGSNNYYTFKCNSTTTFYDRGGVNGNYFHDSDYYTTICPANQSNRVVITAKDLNIKANDVLFVYDEERTKEVTASTLPSSSDLVAEYSGSTLPAQLKSEKGCLTFRFTSNASNNDKGWIFDVDCEVKPSICDLVKSSVDSDVWCGVKVTDTNIRGKSTFADYGDCTMPGWLSEGRELIYRYTNPAAGDILITLKENSGNQPKRLNMYLLSDCNPDACFGNISRPAPNGSQDKDYIYYKNAPAGVYYIVVDGNTSYAINQFELLVECGGGDYSACDNAYYYDDFEASHTGDKSDYQVDYNVGDYITRVNEFWFMNTGSGPRDARISDTKASNGTQSLEINRAKEGTQNVNFDLADKYEGTYRIAWDMYVAPYKTAFFGLFGGDNSDPWGTVNKKFNFQNEFAGRWFTVELFVDLDKNKYALLLDNRYHVYEGDYYLNLDKLNFYGLPGAHFYIDNFCYAPVDKIPVVSAKVAVLDNTPLSREELLEMTNMNASNESQFNTSITSTNFGKDDLQVVPNPVRGITQITLNLTQEQNVTLELFSHSGQMIRTITTGRTSAINTSVDLSDLPNGMYLLRAKGEQTVITKKIVIQQ